MNPVMGTGRGRITLALVIVLAALLEPALAQPPAARIGAVIMHGKGGSPTRYVAELASFLEGRGYLVANLEMPWSGRRSYDADVGGAEKEVEAALADLRAKGAAKLFVAGHSQGGLFALYLGGRRPVDGIVAIAPGGNVASPVVREKLAESVAKARRLVADGQGGQTTRFLDFEGSRGTYPIVSTPAVYLGWFDPDGPMNQSAAVRSVNPQVPVLFIAPKGDYPGLLRAKQAMFDALPRHPLTRLYEPDSSHLQAPSASREEIVRWTTEVATRPDPAPPGAPPGRRP